jgi:hypothetical protein
MEERLVWSLVFLNEICTYIRRIGEIRFTERINCIIKELSVQKFKRVYLAQGVSGKRYLVFTVILYVQYLIFARQSSISMRHFCCTVTWKYIFLHFLECLKK